MGVVYTSGFLHDSFRFVAAEFGFFGQAEEGRTKKPAAGPVTLTSGGRRGRPLGVDTFALGDDHVIK